MTDDNFIVEENQTGLYYRNFKYKLSLKCSGVMSLRRYINEMKLNPDRFQDQDILKSLLEFDSKSAYSCFITKDADSKIYQFSLKFLNEIRAFNRENIDYKIRIEHYNLSIFLNNVDHIKRIIDNSILPIPYKIHYRCFKTKISEIGYDSNALYRKKSNFNYRMYLRLSKLSDQEKSDFVTFLESYKDQLSLSPRLIHYLKPRSYSYNASGFFIDYRDEKLGLVLAMKFTKHLEKICEIRIQ